MAGYTPSQIRNVVLAGHAGSGKTTLVERLLFSVGALTRMGSVEEGNTVSDHTELEREHKHSINPAVVHFDHAERRVNLIDTPGLADFVGHAIASFPAAETVAVVVDAVKGIESTTRRVMSVAADRNLPRLLIVNKIEAGEADLAALVEQMQETFGSVCLPINLPSGGRETVVNVLDKSDGSAEIQSVEEAHTKLIDQVVEVDEDLMTAYLEQGPEALDKDKLHDTFEQALCDGHLVPICFCSAKTGAGVDDLLNVIARLCPSPVEGNPRPFLLRKEDGTEEEFKAEPDPGKPAIAHVFQVTADPFVGKLGLFRVHQGTVRAKSELYIDDQRKALRISHLFGVNGKEHKEVQELVAGDIGAVSKLDEIHFNGVLHESPDHGGLRLRPLPLPKPMFGLAIELKNHADEAKFGTATSKLMEEDPCFVVERIAATKQTVMRGLGELHLRVMLERLKSQFGIEIETAPPKIAYKETIAGKAEGHHRHKKQTGGAGQFGEVFLRVEPLPPEHEEGFEFHNETVGGSIPRQFMPAIEKGIRKVMADGAIAGYPMTGVCVRVYDGKHHPVDSKEIAFITAGKRAFIDAVQKASPSLLEPIVDLEITAPSRCLGDITGDLAGKRGRVQSTDMIGSDLCLVRAQAPLGELQNYSNELKSMTGGQGSYTMDYSHDEQTPPHIQQEVVAAYKPHGDED